MMLGPQISTYYIHIAVFVNTFISCLDDITEVDEKTPLINPKWTDNFRFKDFDWIILDPSEPFAASCLPVNNHIIYPATFPITRAKLEGRGYKVKPSPLTNSLMPRVQVLVAV